MPKSKEVKVLRRGYKKIVVIDGRDKTDAQIKKIAEQKLLNGESIVEDSSKGGHGFFFAGNLINYYNVKSVCDRIIVASAHSMTPAQTRPMARTFLESKGTK